MSSSYKLGFNVKQGDLVLVGGLITAVGVGYLLFKDAFAMPPPPPPATGPDAVSLTVAPATANRGDTVNATGTFTKQGTPIVVPNAYLRISQGGTVIDQSVTTNTSTVNKAINTALLPAGTYLVEISDNPNYS